MDSTRRNFLKSASILTICVIGFKDVYALAGGKKKLLGSSSVPIRRSPELEAFLSQLFGVPVTITKVGGNDVLNIPGYDPIVLGIQLDTVVITGTGKVISTIDNSELYSGPSMWAPELVAVFGGIAMNMPSSAISGAYNIATHNITPVASGWDGISTFDAVSTAVTSMGIAMSYTDMVTYATTAQTYKAVSSAGTFIGYIGIGGNLLEIFDDNPDTSAERLEDMAQIILAAIILTTPVGMVGAIAGGILLGAWEIWEVKRNIPNKKNAPVIRRLPGNRKQS
ncbi:MAG: hypothetical protein EOO99_07365 [Pedobacter sp.]|nr:MAG: hypothetical protein EOO99_07365 [Pedobacter sp.]